MHPDLIDFGFLHLKTYGAMMALGFMLAWLVMDKLSKRKDLGDFLMYLMIGGVVGSRIAYVIEHWSSEFAARPMDVIRVDQGGLMFYGGLILSSVVFFVWCAIKREHPLKLADLCCTVLPLGHALGRIGCFFYGCCYGKQSEAACAVCFPLHSPAWYEQFHAGLIDASAKCSLPVLPTQLFESAALFVLFLVLLAMYLKFRRGTAGAYLVAYGCIRFGMEYLRGDPRAAVGPFSIGQTISIALILIGFVLLTVSFRKGGGDGR